MTHPTLIAHNGDLNGTEAGSAALITANAAEPGSKALGALLVGALTTELHGEIVGLKVVRYLCSRLVEQPNPIRLKLSRKGSDGAEVLVKLEGSPRNPDAMKALLHEAEDVVSFWRHAHSELANYHGSYTNANGPKGEYRKQTTPGAAARLAATTTARASASTSSVSASVASPRTDS